MQTPTSTQAGHAGHAGHPVPPGRLVVGGRDHGSLTARGVCAGMAITLFDPVAGVGGLLHYLVARPKDHQQARACPQAFALSGLPALFQTVEGLGGDRGRLVVCAAGGSSWMGDESGVGARNRESLRALLMRVGIPLVAEDVGGSDSRRIGLDLVTGIVTSTIRDRTHVLWRP